MTPILELEGLSKSFGPGPAAVKDVALALAAGEFFCLLGPSGCGKSTLLRLIGGYLPPDRGTIRVSGAEITDLPPESRQMGMVFQSYALFPHLSAAENVAFGLRVRRVRAEEIGRRVSEVLDWVGLSETQRQRLPRELSGGQQQRVALARALVIEPRVLMLDEPFANLDRPMRERLREDLRDIQRRARVSTILVTHDRDEALTLADRLGVMQEGALVQVGTPRDVYENPRSEFVAGLLGPASFLPVRVVGESSIEVSCGLTLHRAAWPNLSVGDVLCIRPEKWRVGPAAEGVLDHWTGTITETKFIGSRAWVSVRIGRDCAVQVALSEGGPGLEPPAQLAIGLAPEAAAVIPREHDVPSSPPAR